MTNRILKYQTRLTDFDIAETFGDDLLKFYKAKEKEILLELLPFYDKLDYINNGPYDDIAKKLLVAFMTRREKILMDSLTHIRKVVRMVRRMNGAGAMAVLPIEEAKRVPMMELFEFKNIKRTGRRVMVNCPIHSDGDERTPSMLINSNNVAHCFSCNKTYDNISLYQAVNKVDFIAAVRAINAVKR